MLLNDTEPNDPSKSNMSHTAANSCNCRHFIAVCVTVCNSRHKVGFCAQSSLMEALSFPITSTEVQKEKSVAGLPSSRVLTEGRPPHF